jgi:hypothetical protein
MTEGVSDGAEGAIWSGGPNRGANAGAQATAGWRASRADRATPTAVILG